MLPLTTGTVGGGWVVAGLVVVAAGTVVVGAGEVVTGAGAVVPDASVAGVVGGGGARPRPGQPEGAERGGVDDACSRNAEVRLQLFKASSTSATTRRRSVRRSTRWR